jgi:hypothetical protein
MIIVVGGAAGTAHGADPIEYRFTARRGVVHQREVGRHVPSFAAGLRCALRAVGQAAVTGTALTRLRRAHPWHRVLVIRLKRAQQLHGQLPAVETAVKRTRIQATRRDRRHAEPRCRMAQAS